MLILLLSNLSLLISRAPVLGVSVPLVVLCPLVLSFGGCPLYRGPVLLRFDRFVSGSR